MNIGAEVRVKESAGSFYDGCTGTYLGRSVIPHLSDMVVVEIHERGKILFSLENLEEV